MVLHNWSSLNSPNPHTRLSNFSDENPWYGFTEFEKTGYIKCYPSFQVFHHLLKWEDDSPVSLLKAFDSVNLECCLRCCDINQRRASLCWRSQANSLFLFLTNILKPLIMALYFLFSFLGCAWIVVRVCAYPVCVNIVRWHLAARQPKVTCVQATPFWLSTVTRQNTWLTWRLRTRSKPALSSLRSASAGMETWDYPHRKTGVFKP